MYIDKNTIAEAIYNLMGTASADLNIWLTLKYMGLTKNDSVIINTGNSKDALLYLSDCGDREYIYIPFAQYTPGRKNFFQKKEDAPRSIIQTNLVKISKGTRDLAKGILRVEPTQNSEYEVSTSFAYPNGLGHGRNGFALDDNSSVRIPAEYYAIWLNRFNDVEDKTLPDLVYEMQKRLNLTEIEFSLVFASVDGVKLNYSHYPIDDETLSNICHAPESFVPVITASNSIDIHKFIEDQSQYDSRFKRVAEATTTYTDIPSWIYDNPTEKLAELISLGERTLLLYGPPRTGKTHSIRALPCITSENSVFIQMHENQGYSNLITGLFPVYEKGQSTPSFQWQDGVLLEAIREGKKYIVLEEINRTNIVQAIGELFSLIESDYRNTEITLSSGEPLSIPDDVTFIMTMNNIDLSTESVDDALLGRTASVYYAPRTEALYDLLRSKHIDKTDIDNIVKLFNKVQEYYPLGHGYFASYSEKSNLRQYYLAHIRPILFNHFSSYQEDVILTVDTFVQALTR